MLYAQSHLYRTIVNPTPALHKTIFVPRANRDQNQLEKESKAHGFQDNQRRVRPWICRYCCGTDAHRDIVPSHRPRRCPREDHAGIADKDYGKSRYSYPDFTQTRSGLQYKDMVVGQGVTFNPGKKAVARLGWGTPWDTMVDRSRRATSPRAGHSQARTKTFFRFSTDDDRVIPAFKEAIVGMHVGTIRRVIVPSGSELGYPSGKKWRVATPQPSNFFWPTGAWLCA